MVEYDTYLFIKPNNHIEILYNATTIVDFVYDISCYLAWKNIWKKLIIINFLFLAKFCNFCVIKRKKKNLITLMTIKCYIILCDISPFCRLQAWQCFHNDLSFRY